MELETLRQASRSLCGPVTFFILLVAGMILAVEEDFDPKYILREVSYVLAHATDWCARDDKNVPDLRGRKVVLRY